MIDKKTLPPTYVLLALTVMMGLHFLVPVTQIIGTPFNLSSIILIGVGLMMNVVASNAFNWPISNGFAVGYRKEYDQ